MRLDAFEDRNGVTGPWFFSQDGLASGLHSFEARAFALIIDSNGNLLARGGTETGADGRSVDCSDDGNLRVLQCERYALNTGLVRLLEEMRWVHLLPSRGSPISLPIIPHFAFFTARS